MKHTVSSVPHKRGGINRREFLRRTGGLVGGAAAASILAGPQSASAGAAAGPVIKLGAVFPLTGPSRHPTGSGGRQCSRGDQVDGWHAA
jgi:hypothetical protein